MSRSEILGSSEDNFTIIFLLAEIKFEAFCSLLLYFFSKMYAKNCLWYIFICVFSYFTLFCILIYWHNILKIAFLRPQTGSTIIFQETRVSLYGWKISTLVKLGLKVGYFQDCRYLLRLPQLLSKTCKHISGKLKYNPYYQGYNRFIYLLNLEIIPNQWNIIN